MHTAAIWRRQQMLIKRCVCLEQDAGCCLQTLGLIFVNDVNVFFYKTKMKEDSANEAHTHAQSFELDAHVENGLREVVPDELVACTIRVKGF